MGIPKFEHFQYPQRIECDCGIDGLKKKAGKMAAFQYPQRIECDCGYNIVQFLFVLYPFSILSGSSATAAFRSSIVSKIVLPFSILSGSSATAAESSR